MNRRLLATTGIARGPRLFKAAPRKNVIFVQRRNALRSVSVEIVPDAVLIVGIHGLSIGGRPASHRNLHLTD